MTRQNYTRCDKCLGRIPYCQECNHTGFKYQASAGADQQAESTVAIDASVLAGRSTEGGPA